MGFGNVFISKDNKKAYGRYGLCGTLLKINKDKYISGSYHIREYDGKLAIEENLNQRNAVRINELFKDKFGVIYDECDIKNPENKDYECLYDYWNFLTENFYHEYNDRINDARVTEGKSFFFDNGIMPATNKAEKVRDYIKSQYGKIVNPESYEDQGFLSYSKLVRLGDIVECFQKDILPILLKERVGVEEVNAQGGDNYDKLPEDVRKSIEELEQMANEVVDSMIEDNRINRRRAITRTFRRADAKDVMSFVRGKTETIRKYTSDGVEKFITSKFKKNNATPVITEEDKELEKE
jgi:hypothetical protein